MWVWVYANYQTGRITILICVYIFLVFIAGAVVNNVAYLGCFSWYRAGVAYFTTRYRDTLVTNNPKRLTSGQRSPKFCLNHCKASGFPFAALTTTRLPGIPGLTSTRLGFSRPWSKGTVGCFCGHLYGRYTVKQDDQCDAVCEDDNQSRCGSKRERQANYAVYRQLPAGYVLCK